MEINQEFDNDIEIAWCLNNLGSIKIAQHLYNEAIDYFNQALDVSIKINYLLVQVNAYKNLSLIYIEIKDFEKARNNLENALKICQITNNQYDLCQTYQHYGKMYFSLKQYKQALYYTNKSLEIAKASNFLAVSKEI